MNKTIEMSSHGFEEMTENELLSVDGGLVPLIVAGVVFAAFFIGATQSCSPAGNQMSNNFGKMAGK